MTTCQAAVSSRIRNGLDRPPAPTGTRHAASTRPRPSRIVVSPVHSYSECVWGKQRCIGSQGARKTPERTATRGPLNDGTPLYGRVLKMGAAGFNLRPLACEES